MTPGISPLPAEFAIPSEPVEWERRNRKLVRTGSVMLAFFIVLGVVLLIASGLVSPDRRSTALIEGFTTLGFSVLFLVIVFLLSKPAPTSIRVGDEGVVLIWKGGQAQALFQWERNGSLKLIRVRPNPNAQRDRTLSTDWALRWSFLGRHIVSEEAATALLQTAGRRGMDIRPHSVNPYVEEYWIMRQTKGKG